MNVNVPFMEELIDGRLSNLAMKQNNTDQYYAQYNEETNGCIA